MKVNYVVAQKADGTGNFPDDPDVRFLFEHSFVTINDLWSKLKRPQDPDCYPYDDFLDDTFIRFELNEIIYVQDDYYWNADNGSFCPNDRGWFLNDLEREIRSNPIYDHAINVYMPNLPDVYQALVIDRTLVDQPKGKSPCSELPTNLNLSRSSRINMAGGYNKFWWMKNVVPTSKEYNPNGSPWIPDIRGWMTGSAEHTMAHELGHTMGLSHHNEFHRRNQCDESILNQGHGKPHNYLQPTEIGKIHRNLRMTNLRHFLAEDVYSSVPMVIDEDLEFNMDFMAFEDIIVEEGVTMTVTCALSLPAEAKIYLATGANLIIDNAHITHRGVSDSESLIIAKRPGCKLFGKRKASAEVLIKGTGNHDGTVENKKVAIPRR